MDARLLSLVNTFVNVASPATSVVGRRLRQRSLCNRFGRQVGVMGSLARNIRRKKRLQQEKVAKTQLKKALRVSQEMPSTCVGCDTSFDRDVPSALDDWHIVDPGSGSVLLYCSECWEMSDGA